MASDKKEFGSPSRSEHETPPMPAQGGAPALEGLIGPYRILRELGRGGMGTVYLAARADEQFRKRVALKVIRSGADSEEVVRRFKRERQILAGLNHPNIAKLLDGGTTEDGLPYLVMEYIEGQPLLAYCDAGRLPVAERLKLFQAICSAVQYAHRNLIVHRDLKPNHILVGVDGVPRLLDFGIAKLLNPELSAEALTATGLAMTPEYASPEQARGEPITTATDVYSLGVILYELLTGQRPYRVTSRNPLEVLRAVVEDAPQKPSTAVERMRAKAFDREEASATPLTAVHVSQARGATPGRLQKKLRGDLDNIVMLALRKEPQRRYASVEAFSDDVRRYLEGLPVRARKPTVGYRTRKFVGRHAVGVAVSVAVVVLLVGFAVAMAVQSARVARERDLARKERETAQRERETAQRVSAFLVDLFKVSDPGEARGNTVTAREVLDKGAAKIATELKDQPEVRATLMDTMGDVYRNLGLYDKAVSLLKEALETRKAILGREHLEVAASLNNLANVFLEKGDYVGAESLYQEALAMRRKLLGNEHLDVAASLGGVAGVLAMRGDYAGAELLYRETLAIRRKLHGNEHPRMVRTLNNLAMTLAAKGDRSAAEALHREALAMGRKLLGNEHPDVVMSLDSLAALLAEKGDYAGAEVLHRQSLALWRKLLGNEHPDVAASLTSLAETLSREQKLTEAEAAAREALAIFRKTLPSGHHFVAEAKSVLGGCLALSRRYGEAEPLLLEGYAVLTATTGQRSPETRETLERIIQLYEAWGKANKAAKYRAELAG